MTTDPRITHIECADPGDEQAERREFKGMMYLDEEMQPIVEISWDGEGDDDYWNLCTRVASGESGRIRCRVTIEEG